MEIVEKRSKDDKKLFSKPESDAITTRKNSTGSKIRALRTRKNITVKELGEACDVNENSIRNYELGIRQMSEENLDLAAQHLNVPVAALRDRSIEDYVDVMHILFELSSDYGFIPFSLPDDSNCAIITKDEKLNESFRAWYIKQCEW